MKKSLERSLEHAFEWAFKQRAEGKGGWLVGHGFVALLKDGGGALKIRSIWDGWVDCSLRMPLPGTKVLVMKKGFDLPFCGWWSPNGEKEWEIEGRYIEQEKVSHWTFLPYAPEELQ